MKKVFTIIFSLMLLTAMSQVRDDAKARALLDQMSKKYNSSGAFKVDFEFHLKSPATGKDENMDGTITVKGDNYRLKTSDGKEVYKKGTALYTYYASENECDIFEHSEEDDMFSLQNMVKKYKTGYKYYFQNDITFQGRQCFVIDLEPDLSPEERAKVQEFKIRMVVDKSSKELKKVKVFERNGNRYTTTVTKFLPSIAVSDSFFTFDKSKYPGVIIEDLR